MMESVVRIDRFSKRYGRVRAVEEVSLTVRAGELFGLIGPDGAGKTTTMRTLVTLLRPDSGTLTVAGLDTVRETARIRTMIGYMPQRFSLYPDLSIDQNLNFFAELFGVRKDEIPRRKERLYRFSRLEEFRDRLAGRLSGGMKQKLALSCTLIHDPLLLVLDEPTTGVDPVSRAEFWEILGELRRGGTTIFVSTPYMDEAMRCDRVAVMHEGRVLLDGDPRAFVGRSGDRLYKLRSAGALDAVPLLHGIPGLRSLQPFGDAFHLAAGEELPEESLRAHLRDILRDDFLCERITPSLEDIFIRLIEERVRANGEARP